MLKNTWLEPLVWWAYAAVAVTGMCTLVYSAVQQNYRQSLNDPQIQMAEDAAAALAGGAQIDQAIPAGKVDIANSLAPWVAFYNSTGAPLLSSGQLGGAPPQLPAGVFDTSQWSNLIIGHHLNSAPANENRFTWQPEDGVRQAVVLVHLDGPAVYGFVAAGRNMREVEGRESQLSFDVLMLWSFTLGCLFVASFAGWWLLKPR
ncbi:MAG: hypothetical protein KGH79_02900 [Patescibacteria group bacterium]|nr:hypothetical protein [Patescibacteria group bacterium]